MQTFQLTADQVSALAAFADPADWAQVAYGNGQLVVPDDVADRLAPGNAGTLLAARKAQMLVALAERRWRAETGGILVAGGMTVATDDRSKTMIMGARIKADADGGYTLRWKTSAGFQTLDAATIIAISDAVLAHVATCFDREDALSADIDAAADQAALDAIDIDIGWP